VFYTALLFVHSWLRWVLVALILIAIARSVRGARGDLPWLPADSRVRVATVAAFDTQFMLGLILYFISPVTPKSGAAFGAYMKVSQLRFFSVEHVFSMVLAVATLHIGSVRSKKADNDHDQHKRWAIAVGIALFFVLAGIPWPFLAHGRPLFRVP